MKVNRVWVCCAVDTNQKGAPGNGGGERTVKLEEGGGEGGGRDGEVERGKGR